MCTYSSNFLRTNQFLGLDSSTGIEDKPMEEQPLIEEKKRRLDLAP